MTAPLSGAIPYAFPADETAGAAGSGDSRSGIRLAGAGPALPIGHLGEELSFRGGFLVFFLFGFL